jgi:hypothetical protein
LLPTVTNGVPELVPILPAPANEPAVRLKPASAIVPVSVRFPEDISVLATSVTVCPAAIITLSPETGTTPPTQVAVSFQLPVVTEVIVVCENKTDGRMINKKVSNFWKSFLFDMIVDYLKLNTLLTT